jgi:hypothetical protein
MGSIVANGTVDGGVVVPVALDTPTHLQGLGHLLDDLDLFDHSVTFLALQGSGISSHVSHMGESDMVGDLVDADPRNGLSPIPVVPELVHLLGIVPPLDDEVTSHTGGDRRNACVHRTFRREVAVLAVDLEIACVGVVRERDGMDRRREGSRRRTLPLLGLDEGQGDGGRHDASDRD